MFCESSRFIDYSHEIQTGRRMVCSVQQQHVQEMCGQHFASLFEFHSKPYLLLFVHREQRQSRNNLRTMLIVFALRIFINFFLSICFWFGSVESCCNMSKYVQNGRNSLSLTANTGTWTWTWTNEKLQRSTWLFDLTHTHAHILSISLAKHWYPITHKIGSYIFSNIFASSVIFKTDIENHRINYSSRIFIWSTHVLRRLCYQFFPIFSFVMHAHRTQLSSYSFIFVSS